MTIEELTEEKREHKFPGNRNVSVQPLMATHSTIVKPFHLQRNQPAAGNRRKVRGSPKALASSSGEHGRLDQTSWGSTQ